MDIPADARRAFDFWIGTWDVFTPDGKQVGTNRIEVLHDGLALAEHWEGAGGIRGTSLNTIDPATGRWHQTWVDSGGSLLLLDGGPVDGEMVLEGVGTRRRRRPPHRPAAHHLDTDAGWLGTPALGGVRRRRRCLAHGLRRALPASRLTAVTIGPGRASERERGSSRPDMTHDPGG